MDLNNINNGQQLILSEELYNSVTEIIETLAKNTNANSVIFCESTGYPVTYTGDIKSLDISVISSLAASNFSATAKMASLLGEKNSFKYLYHEGEYENLYISNVGFNFLLLIIFKVDVALGMIRIYTKKAIKSLGAVLQTARQDEKKSKDFIDLE